MPIRIRRRAKNNVPTQEYDMKTFMSDEMSFPPAFYTAIEKAFGVLYGYI
jgi:hypothetical protein